MAIFGLPDNFFAAQNSLWVGAPRSISKQNPRAKPLPSKVLRRELAEPIGLGLGRQHLKTNICKDFF
jgi:hypothetical protein